MVKCVIRLKRCAFKMILDQRHHFDAVDSGSHNCPYIFCYFAIKMINQAGCDNVAHPNGAYGYYRYEVEEDGEYCRRHSP